ncbi:MAG: DUF3800 domain-containing protein [Candidatus Absconditabacterales bacterium]
MLVLIDESGDHGFNFKKGASTHFTIGMAIFEDIQKAEACRSEISVFKKQLGLKSGFEFHFKNNSDRLRKAFFELIRHYDFFYYGYVLDKTKTPKDLFRSKNEFYSYICGLVFEKAKDKLDGATVIIDKHGSKDFKEEISHYLKKKMNTDEVKRIKKVAMHRSESDNLVQLVDYVTGAIHRHYSKSGKVNYRDYIKHREVEVDTRPRS